MRARFDQQLETLNAELIRMGSLCEEAIEAVTKILLHEKKADMEEIFLAEEEINQKERDIESLCMKLLLQQQPVARDLRQISAALKMIADMERIGDQAADIADLTKYIQVREQANKIHIGEMAAATTKMVSESIESFVKKDLHMAKEVVKYDDIVDDLFVKVKEELTKLVAEDAKNSEYYIDLIMVAKYFERIGDHAENIAQWVEYSITGVYQNTK